jgi:hypothetical protein
LTSAGDCAIERSVLTLPSISASMPLASARDSSSIERSSSRLCCSIALCTPQPPMSASGSRPSAVSWNSRRRRRIGADFGMEMGAGKVRLL